MSSITGELDPAEKITLQVGTERFTTQAETLTSKSDFFKKFLSPPWAKPQEDGSYFLDADPVLFAYILQYLRRESFPIFYDDVNGHDYAKYVALQQEADYFGLINLTNWLKKKKYLEAVRVSYLIEEFENSAHGIEMLEGNLTNVKLELWPRWSSRNVYVCPRNIIGHRGRPDSCGRRCLAARKVLGVQWEAENVLGGALLSQTTIIDDELCLDRSSEED